MKTIEGGQKNCLHYGDHIKIFLFLFSSKLFERNPQNDERAFVPLCSDDFGQLINGGNLTISKSIFLLALSQD